MPKENNAGTANRSSFFFCTYDAPEILEAQFNHIMEKIKPPIAGVIFIPYKRRISARVP